MTRGMGGAAAGVVVCVLFQSVIPVLRGQNPPPAPKVEEPEKQESKPPGRLAIGLRLRTFPIQPLSAMAEKRTMATTVVSRTPYDWSFNTSAGGPGLGAGVAAEVRLAPRMRLTAELMYSGLSYNQVTDTYWGADDPTTGGDERSHSSITESTKARLFDLPMLLHYQLGRSGLLSRTYVSIGASARSVSRIRTTTDITNADGATEKNQAPAPVSRRNLIGAVAGIGFRFVDEFNIKVTPEIRYTRWTGATFSSGSTRSPRDQLEVGIAFTR